MEQLKAEEKLLAFKASADPAPGDSALEAETFFLAFQTEFQREMWKKYGHGRLACINATHNVTQYSNMQLYTLLARDEHGHGGL
jgi:hypothetical protein